MHTKLLYTYGLQCSEPIIINWHISCKLIIKIKNGKKYSISNFNFIASINGFGYFSDAGFCHLWLNIN